MSLIEKLKEDFSNRRRKLEVLGEEVWVTPMTVGENTVIGALYPNDSAARSVETLVRKCRDAEGNPIFGKNDKEALRSLVAGDRLGPIFAAIHGPSTAELEKKSETDDPPNT